LSSARPRVCACSWPGGVLACWPCGVDLGCKGGRALLVPRDSMPKLFFVLSLGVGR
jgi:hypothetical protein